MTNEKLAETLKIYEHAGGDWNSDARYCTTMVPRALKFIEEGEIDKAHRWLVFIQGVMWVEKIYTLEELKAHSRSA